MAPTALPSSLSGSFPFQLSTRSIGTGPGGKLNFNFPTGFPNPFAPPSSGPSPTFFFFFALPPCSLSGLFRGLEILPVGGRRGLGKRCFCGRSSSSMSGSSLLAWSLARKKFWTRPICDLTLWMVTGSYGGGGSKAEADVEMALRIKG